ncbi:MAG: motility-associated protein [Pseudomonadota bacterium]
MTQLLAFLAVLALIGGALLMSGGRGIANALPFEFALIAGAALCTLFIANSVSVARGALSGFVAAARGARWREADYLGALALLHGLFSGVRNGGLVGIDGDIEAPETSVLFARAPAVLADADAEALVCDTFRLLALDFSNPARAREQLDEAVDAAVSRRMRAVAALHQVADALPALGIVAAVIGIIKTMGAIDQDPAIIGAMIASALRGTFLGVFLAYGVVGPVASRFGQVVEEEAALLDVLRDGIAAHLSGMTPRGSVEIARARIPEAVRPDAQAIDHALQAARFSRETAQAA